jgi:hypothetical protein
VFPFWTQVARLCLSFRVPATSRMSSGHGARPSIANREGCRVHTACALLLRLRQRACCSCADAEQRRHRRRRLAESTGHLEGPPRSRRSWTSHSPSCLSRSPSLATRLVHFGPDSIPHLHPSASISITTRKRERDARTLGGKIALNTQKQEPLQRCADLLALCRTRRSRVVGNAAQRTPVPVISHSDMRSLSGQHGAAWGALRQPGQRATVGNRRPSPRSLFEQAEDSA